MKDEDFDRAYKLMCDEMDHGNTRYGARNLPVTGVTE